jgi:hypothetical protein
MDLFGLLSSSIPVDKSTLFHSERYSISDRRIDSLQSTNMCVHMDSSSSPMTDGLVPTTFAAGLSPMGLWAMNFASCTLVSFSL